MLVLVGFWYSIHLCLTSSSVRGLAYFLLWQWFSGTPPLLSTGIQPSSSHRVYCTLSGCVYILINMKTWFKHVLKYMHVCVYVCVYWVQALGIDSRLSLTNFGGHNESFQGVLHICTSCISCLTELHICIQHATFCHFVWRLIYICCLFDVLAAQNG